MLKQSLQQKLLQKLSPQQIQLMKLLQVPTMELEQRIKEELEENPALEEGSEESSEEEFSNEGEDDLAERESEEISEAQEEFDFDEYMGDDDVSDDTPYYNLQVQNKGPDDEEKEIPIGSGISFHESLRNQIHLKDLTEHEKQVAGHLIGTLDDAGYLTRDLESIVDDLAFSQNIETDEEELEKLLNKVQEMEPAGVGARDLRECLLLQIERQDHSDPAVCNAERILEDHFEAFTKKHYDKIAQKLEISDEDLKAAMEEITALDPKPGGSMRETMGENQQITPDFIVTVRDGEPELSLNTANDPDLKVNGTYEQMLKEYKQKKQERETYNFVKKKVDSAKWFIEAIKQRQQTLYLTMSTIIRFQKDYFRTGDETKLKPMILKDIADILGLDISTISRVVNSKYVQTPYGTFLLKSFFSESISTSSGEEVSTREVKRILQDLIEQEDKKKPLSDEKLAAYLRDKGYNIARRTVAKYREQLSIPVARMRKEL
jgi:RNA polymerase sigma-54 factor